MLILSFSWFKSERFWRFAIGSLFSLGFLGGVFLGSVLIFPPPPGSFGLESNTPVQKQAPVDETPGYETPGYETPGYETPGYETKYDCLLTGAFSLEGGSSSKYASLVLSELKVIGVNTRPEHEHRDKVLVELARTGEKRMLERAHPTFLQIEKGEEGALRVVGFAIEQGGLRLSVVGVKGGGVVFELAMEGEKESGEVVMPNGCSHLSESPYFKQLMGAKWWGVDAFLKEYGGQEYAQWAEKQKIELMQKEGAECLFVGPNDCLVWDESDWKVVSEGVDKRGKPLARVDEVAPRMIELSVWDSSGFFSEKVRLTLQSQSNRPLKMDSLPSAIRLRSESQVSCLLDKRRMLLKEGDWVLRTAHGWRLLKSVEEIEDFLAHRLQGDLLVFDTLEHGQGRILMHGHYFDAMRTQMQKITIPVSSESHSRVNRLAQNP